MEQTGRFADWQPFYGVYSPGERAEFVAPHEKDNSVLAAMLGKKTLFSPVDPDEPWEPFTGLTEASALRVAERLDRDFACERMAEMDAAPLRYLTREQRVVRQALHDACDPPFAAPPMRSRAKEPKLSVLTPTYNHADFIGQCIESVLAQRVNFPLQHIIADDGSDDGTQDIILDYAAKYPHIVPVFQKARSYGAGNLRALFDMARTEYAAVCDGDDYFTDPEKLQTQVDFLDKHKDCGLCFHIVRVTYEDDPGRERLYPPVEGLPRGVRPFYYLSDLVKCNLIQTNSVMYRWRFKDGLPDWFRTDLMPGDWYWHLLHAETGKIGFINKVMSVYRRHRKGVYYLSEVDKLKHRATVGKSEIEVYDVINKHFKGTYESALLDLINGVFSECLLYDAQRAEKDGAEPVLSKLCDAYPKFARHFLNSLKSVNGAKEETAPPADT
jgi:glycosyltransferase involved in cell wall biosynthesis